MASVSTNSPINTVDYFAQLYVTPISTIEQPSVSNHVVQPESSNVENDQLLDQVFSAVKFIDVQYTSKKPEPEPELKHELEHDNEHNAESESNVEHELEYNHEHHVKTESNVEHKLDSETNIDTNNDLAAEIETNTVHNFEPTSKEPTETVHQNLENENDEFTDTTVKNNYQPVEKFINEHKQLEKKVLAELDNVLKNTRNIDCFSNNQENTNDEYHVGNNFVELAFNHDASNLDDYSNGVHTETIDVNPTNVDSDNGIEGTELKESNDKNKTIIEINENGQTNKNDIELEKQQNRLKALHDLEKLLSVKRNVSPVLNRVTTADRLQQSKSNGVSRPKSAILRKTPSIIPLYEESIGVSKTLQAQLNNTTLISEENDCQILRPQVNYESLGDLAIERITIGGAQEPTKDDKVVLLFGPKSAGKTSFITSLLNHVYEVKKEHRFRLCINNPRDVQPTQKITEYVFHNTIYPYRLTIVDTPGVPQEKGYDKTSTAISQWFQNELKAKGTFRLDAISFVVKHHEEQLEGPVAIELARVKRLFSDDLKTNLLPIITFSEVLPEPLAIRSLVNANVNFLDYYKVQNNSILPLTPKDNALKHSLHFNHTNVSLERYLMDLHNLVQPLLAVLKKKNLNS